MNRKLVRGIGSIVLAGSMLVAADAQDPSALESPASETATSESPTSVSPTSVSPAPQDVSISALRAQSLSALQTGDNEAAIRAADAMIRLYPSDVLSMRRAGDIYLRTGKVDTAVRLFDRYLEAEPDQMPFLWQRGIALYLTGDYKRGAQQFEQHRNVNPEDVENAAWHFLCIAKLDSFEKARQMVLPAPNDPRIPMEEVLQMLTTADTNAVNQRVQSVPEGSRQRADAEFYGNLYLGLYADAKGDRTEARRLVSLAAKDAPHHYMGDVARVYAQSLGK